MVEPQLVSPAQPPINISPAELAAKYQEFQQNQWDEQVNQIRMGIAKRKGLLSDPSVVLSPAELREAAPLEGDKIRYAKDKAGNLRIATNRHGMFSWPKPQGGRKRPHMTKHAMAIKSRAISIFRGMFTTHAAELEATAKEKGEQFLGVPTENLTKIGARASILAALYNKRDAKAARITRRNMQKLSRRINAGVVNGNTNAVRYIG